VIDGETGFLVPRLDPDLYAERALRLLSDPALRERLGANGREHVMQKFSLASMRQRYSALFLGSQSSMRTYTPNANVPAAIASEATIHHGETPRVRAQAVRTAPLDGRFIERS